MAKLKTIKARVIRLRGKIESLIDDERANARDFEVILEGLLVQGKIDEAQEIVDDIFKGNHEIFYRYFNRKIETHRELNNIS